MHDHAQVGLGGGRPRCGKRQNTRHCPISVLFKVISMLPCVPPNGRAPAPASMRDRRLQ